MLNIRYCWGNKIEISDMRGAQRRHRRVGELTQKSWVETLTRKGAEIYLTSQGQDVRNMQHTWERLEIYSHNLSWKA